MTTAPFRKVAALVFALFVAAGSLASAGGSKYYGERVPGQVTVNGGSNYYGE
jgi:hypothetical protein